MRKSSTIFLIFILLTSCNNKGIKTGKSLYLENACNTCHSINGDRMIGPSFKNLYNKKRFLINGDVIIANKDYLIESILYPEKHIVKSYPNLMGSYKKILTTVEIDSLIEFIKNQN
ncbi:MAG: hypothetical protein CBD97_02635 [Pelagibacteraceae bacterium TMED237]|nr:hypothetical protein [Candidatus Neomarinimicrobiota bacterium]OUW95603.1 MAG: hypothetical protein CBD97_02635 [Pelagibacteraceae bacterium TMED237]|tara:strand:+ start:11110 stop:11457 length:348 start_codon:yes stop_codon:yes gene_type:complete